MHCPRCRTENGDAAIRCAGCGAPIALPDDAGTGPVSAPLHLDRRAARREAPSPRWDAPDETPEPVPVFPARSGPAPVPLDWEMAPPADAAATRHASPRFPDRPRHRPPPTAPVAAPVAPAPPEDFDLEPDVEAVLVHRRRAPAWRRVASWIVDGALLAALVAVLLVPVLGGTGPGGGPDGSVATLLRARGILAPVLLVVALVAFSYQWLGVALMGATPGMRVAGLRVVGADGDRPSPGRSAARSLLALPAAAALGSGLLLGLFTRSGQAAHDLGAGTWVVLARDGGDAP